jgi:hypothetical protein
MIIPILQIGLIQKLGKSLAPKSLCWLETGAR